MKRDNKLKSFFAICFLLVGMSFLFASCSKDENNPEQDSGSIDEVGGRNLQRNH